MFDEQLQRNIHNQSYWYMKDRLVQFVKDNLVMIKGIKALTKSELVDHMITSISNGDLSLELMIKELPILFGMTSSEVTEAIGCSPGQIKTMMKRNEMHVMAKALSKRGNVFNMYSYFDVQHILGSDLKDKYQKKVLTLEQKERYSIATEKRQESLFCQSCYQQYKKAENADIINGECRSCRNKFDAVMRFMKELLANPSNYLIFDTETTGLLWCDQIVELALLDLKGNVVMDTLVHTERTISDGAHGVHGLSNKDLINSPKWPQVYAEFLEKTKGKTLLIYNSKFDEGMIWNTCRVNGIEPTELDSICIMKEIAHCFNDHWMKLSSFFEKAQSHRALGDCEMVLELIRNVAKDGRSYLERKCSDEI